MKGQEPQTNIVLKLEMLFGDFFKRISNDMEALHERMDWMELSRTPSKGWRDKNKFRESEDSNNEGSKQRSKLRRWETNWEGYPIKGIKMKIPLLQGRSDPETYLEWERKVEIIIECHNYTKEQKTKLAVIEFTDYASVW